MKLYDARRAPNPRRVRWFMVEKGIEGVEIVDVDLFGGAHKTEDYLRRAGILNVPALTMDDGTTITESVAICRYLEAFHPEPNMFGRTGKEIALVEMWLRRAELMIAHPLMLAVRHGHPALAASGAFRGAGGEASSRQSAERSLEFFDRRFADSQRWLAADRITMADGVLFAGIDFARLVRSSASRRR